MTFTPLLLALLPATAGSMPTAVVELDRVLLQDVAQDVPAVFATLDLGAAPMPGHNRIITRSELRRRLGRAMVPHRQLQLPEKIRIVRAMQQLSEPGLERLIRTALATLLPVDTAISAVRVSGGLRLAAGEVTVALEHVNPAANLQTVYVEVRAGDSLRRVPVTLTLQIPPKTALPLIKRGDRVTLVVRTGGVTIETHSIAQEQGTVGDTIKVLPLQSSKLVYARVISAQWVEVEL